MPSYFASILRNKELQGIRKRKIRNYKEFSQISVKEDNKNQIYFLIKMIHVVNETYYVQITLSILNIYKNKLA